MKLEKDIDLYGVSRIDDDKNYTHAWRVSIARGGKKHVRNFTDLKFGRSEKALSKTKGFRDELLVLYPPMSRREFCEIKRRNNQSGTTGVYRYGKPYKLKDGTIKKLWYWEANWPDENGKSLSEALSVNKHGETTAYLLAVDAREKGLSTVSGDYWASLYSKK